MTISNALPFQGAIHTAISAALTSAGEALEIFDHVPSDPPAEYIRIDGPTGFDRSFKDNERLEHSVQISVFRQPVAGTTIARGNKRPHEIMTIVHDALKDLRFDRGRMRTEDYDLSSGDAVGAAHAWVRYSIVF